MPSPSLAPEKPCPICGKPAQAQTRPFCSSRCADIDLNRWLSGVYAIPVKEDESEDESDRVGRERGEGE
ncbi:MAG TPA: DNA gyrase inhibitor YacG [Pseudorhodoplanes sp.]|jgi:endogenous inhibitor of DNA gyrase (YacG/DUF329 family)|nr:DNA gyrase inhibitor YacG [Pseudorhodoplanes sp.]